MAAEGHFAPRSVRPPATSPSRASPRSATRAATRRTPFRQPERSPQPREDLTCPDQNRSQRGQDGGPRKCYNCEKPGHIAAPCSEPLSAAAIALLDAQHDQDNGDTATVIENEYVEEASSQPTYSEDWQVAQLVDTRHSLRSSNSSSPTATTRANTDDCAVYNHRSHSGSHQRS